MSPAEIGRSDHAHVTRFADGETLRIKFPAFTPLITFHANSRLSVRIVEGDNAGFADTVDYEAVAVREGLVVLSWREHIGSTIVHILDLHSNHAYTVVTPAKGGMMRLQGTIRKTPPLSTGGS
jgi:hypothetical protein